MSDEKALVEAQMGWAEMILAYAEVKRELAEARALIHRLADMLDRSQWGVVIPEAREVVREARKWLR